MFLHVLAYNKAVCKTRQEMTIRIKIKQNRGLTCILTGSFIPSCTYSFVLLLLPTRRKTIWSNCSLYCLAAANSLSFVFCGTLSIVLPVCTFSLNCFANLSFIPTDALMLLQSAPISKGCFLTVYTI